MKNLQLTSLNYESTPLVFMSDYNRPIDSHHVNQIKLALRSLLDKGEVIEPIIVDRQSLSIVDGQHRYSAFRKILEDVNISSEIKSKITLPAIFADIDDPAEAAMQYNSSRKNWTIADYVHYKVGKGDLQYIRLQHFCDDNANYLYTSPKNGNGKPLYKSAAVILGGNPVLLTKGTFICLNIPEEASKILLELTSLSMTIGKLAFNYNTICGWVKFRINHVVNDEYFIKYKNNFKPFSNTQSSSEWIKSFELGL